MELWDLLEDRENVENREKLDLLDPLVERETEENRGQMDQWGNLELEDRKATSACPDCPDPQACLERKASGVNLVNLDLKENRGNKAQRGTLEIKETWEALESLDLKEMWGTQESRVTGVQREPAGSPASRDPRAVLDPVACRETEDHRALVAHRVQRGKRRAISTSGRSACG